MPLTEETKERVEDDIRELEYALGCVFLNLSDSEIQKLESVPDIIEGLGLFMARTALLYTLGYTENLRADKSLPPEETDETVHRMFSILASCAFQCCDARSFCGSDIKGQSRHGRLVKIADTLPPLSQKPT